MTRTAISVGSIPASGLDVVVVATFTTMTAGASNGVEFPYTAGAWAILRNTTGATINFTFKVPTPAAYAAKGVTMPDVTVAVLNTRTLLYPLSPIFMQDDGLVGVDCDAAGMIAVAR